MGKSINKNGLKRYIPSKIRTQIRKDAGFGCVLCGCVLVDYEHIEPEFHEAQEHDPEKMTLLCVSCHGRVTRKLIAKKTIWNAKKKPKALQDGYVHDILFVNTDEMEIRIGNSASKRTEVILTIYGKPIIWFEPPIVKGEPSKLCAIFYDDNGKAISYVNRNQFIAFSSNQDIKSESTELSLVSNGTKCLVMNREGGETLYISKLEGRYQDASASVDSQGSLVLKSGGSTVIIGKLDVKDCGSAIHLGETPAATLKYKRMYVALLIAWNVNTKSISNLRKKVVGWAINDEIFNKNYELVGGIRGTSVFNILQEYIGTFTGSMIANKDNCYESGEPIYTSKENILFKERNPSIGYDVSFRLFGNILEHSKNL